MLVGYGAARAALRGPAGPRYPGSTAPLRPVPPPVGAPAPGPLASRLGTLINSMTDQQLLALRNAMPSYWWSFILVASQMSDDTGFRVALNPVSADLQLWTDAQVRQLQWDLVTAMGVEKAQELDQILRDADVL